MPNDNWDFEIDQRSDALADLNLEIARLQAENAALAEELVNAAKGVDYFEEVLSLRKENERLRTALERIDKTKAFPDEDSRDVLYGKIGIMRDIARAALGGK